MFLCFPLYVVYAALYGIFTIITYYSGFRAGFCFSAGATDLVFSASLPAAAKTWMIIPLGIAAFLVFYFVFYFAITKFDLKTPGREDDDVEESEKNIKLSNNNYTAIATGVLAAVGGLCARFRRFNHFSGLYRVKARLHSRLLRVLRGNRRFALGRAGTA
jgi:PTS system N-acetylglucosamine-specific IIC component